MLKLYVPLLALCLCLPFPAPARTQELTPEQRQELQEELCRLYKERDRIVLRERLIEAPSWLELRQNSPEYLEGYLSGYLSGYRAHTLFPNGPIFDLTPVVSQDLDVQDLPRRMDATHAWLTGLPDLSGTRFADLNRSHVPAWEAINLALNDIYVDAHNDEILKRNREDEKTFKIMEEVLTRLQKNRASSPAQPPEPYLTEIRERLTEAPSWPELRQNSPEYLEAYLSGYLSGYRVHTLSSNGPTRDLSPVISRDLDVREILRQADEIQALLTGMPDLSGTRFADLDLSRIRAWEAITLALNNIYYLEHKDEIMQQYMEDEETFKLMQELLRREQTSRATP